jgi:hypothetical protein
MQRERWPGGMVSTRSAIGRHLSRTRPCRSRLGPPTYSERSRTSRSLATSATCSRRGGRTRSSPTACSPPRRLYQRRPSRSCTSSPAPLARRWRERARVGRPISSSSVPRVRTWAYRWQETESLPGRPSTRCSWSPLGVRPRDRQPAERRARRTARRSRVGSGLMSGQQTVPPSASAVADGGELLGQAAAESRHECEEA